MKFLCITFDNIVDDIRPYEHADKCTTLLIRTEFIFRKLNDLLAVLALLALLLERLLHAQYQERRAIDGQRRRRFVTAGARLAASRRRRRSRGRCGGRSGRTADDGRRVAVHAAVVAGVGTPHAGAERIHRNCRVVPRSMKSGMAEVAGDGNSRSALCSLG